MWGLIIFATFTTLALWTSLQTTYGGTRNKRETLEEARPGLLEGFRKLQHSVDDMLYADPQRIHLQKQQSGSAYLPSVPSAICPEIDIPGDEKNVSINVNETTMLRVEQAIFKESTTKVRQLVESANSLVNKLYATPEGFYRPTVEETLADAILLDNYIYVPGGRWIPANCLPRWKVAIVIPFRNRFFHLPILLKHIIPYLQSQYLEFGIYVVEQANALAFNRAMLMNIGFAEALNFTRWDCFIFHDVDHIPLNYANYYGCSHMPRHFLSGADRWGYKLLYGSFFGAVTGFTRTQIERFNGFPNQYWGWGGEDDDILGRIRLIGFSKSRPWGLMGFYNVIPHHHASAPKNIIRVCLLKHYFERVYTDGLSNLQYSAIEVTVNPLYVNISVDIHPLPYDDKWTECPEKKPEDAAPAAAVDSKKEKDLPSDGKSRKKNEY